MGEGVFLRFWGLVEGALRSDRLYKSIGNYSEHVNSKEPPATLAGAKLLKHLTNRPGSFIQSARRLILLKANLRIGAVAPTALGAGEAQWKSAFKVAHLAAGGTLFNGNVVLDSCEFMQMAVNEANSLNEEQRIKDQKRP